MSSVDVLIVSYNTRSLLLKCLATVRAAASESASSVSIRILDNASSDGTQEVLRTGFADVHSILSVDNILYGPAMNRLVRESDAEYVLLLNPDTEVPMGIFDELVHIVAEHPDVAIAFPRLVDSTGLEQQVSQAFPELSYEVAAEIRGTKLAHLLARAWNADAIVGRYRQKPTPNIPFEMNLVWSTCVMMRTSEAAAYGPFRRSYPMYDTDLDLCRRLASDGRTAYCHSELAVTHVGGASSSGEAKHRMMRSARAQYYREYGGWPHYVAYVGCTGAIPRLKSTLRTTRRLTGLAFGERAD